MKFLVVDDSRLSRNWSIQTLPEALRKKATIFEAEDGEVAVALYKEHRPDIVLLDITMPKKNGFEALEEIRTFDPKAVVIMISADRQKLTRERVLGLGATEILYKPIEADKLRTILLSLATGKRS
ncbi:response regulator [Sulfurospirillum sp. T05]|uniref:Response regulator n=1 Tax=Sulfurospirillum tamanense TaxID=2813362 RepID=A0ABS2WUL5_9BACT|nr:response regulator [Sulfurospirillum tamanensis]MBN2965341.1 response regulator [Sulfurospirillum tamanensis]